jgi:hypothetical protein
VKASTAFPKNENPGAFCFVLAAPVATGTLGYMRAFGAAIAAVAVVSCGRATESADGDGSAGTRSSIGGASITAVGSGGAASGGERNALGGTGGNGMVAVRCQTGSSRSGDIYLKNQSDVDLLSGVNQVDGSLHITDDVADLGPLACLREVTGNLKVYEAKVLKALAGLEGLTTIGKGLIIGTTCNKPQAMCVGNPVLESISALGNLMQVQDISLSSCDTGEGGSPCGPNSAIVRVEFDRLASVEGIDVSGIPTLTGVSFGSLTRATSVEIYGNPTLTELSFGSLTRATSVKISGNSKLRTLSFPKLRSVEALSLRHSRALEQFVVESGIEEAKGVEIYDTGLMDLGWLKLGTGSLSVSDNWRLASLDGLQHLKTAGSIVLNNNPALTTVDALRALESIEGDLYVQNNAVLGSLAGLEQLTTVKRLFIDANAQLSNLEGLSSLATLGSLGVSENPKLVSLRGLSSLTALGSLSIRFNAQLPNLEGLEKVDLQAGTVQVDDNAQLSSLEGLYAVTQLESLELETNLKLADLSALKALTRVRSDLRILRNSTLKSLTGLDQLSHVGSLSIAGNDGLLGLGGLGALETVDSIVVIGGNNSLTSLAALASLKAAYGLEVRDNPRLAQCEAERLRSQLGSALMDSWISGNKGTGACAP